MKGTEYAVIVAGGSGRRMHSSIPKQFMPIAGTPLLMHTVKAFYRYSPEVKIFLVLPEKDIERWKLLCSEYDFTIPVETVVGGNSRFQSVRNGLSAIRDRGVVAIHDGVRPLVSLEIIRNAYRQAMKNGSAVAAMPVKESIRQKMNGATVAVDRNKYLLVQTPQTFNVDQIKDAFANLKSENFTDDASVYEHSGKQVFMIEGSYRNIKITTREDLVFAEALLKNSGKKI